MDRVSKTTGWIALVTFLAAAGGAARSDDARIAVRYASVPTRPLPLDVKVINVRKPDYLHRASDDGIMRDMQTRWYNLLIRRLESKLRAAAPHVTAVNWEDRAATGDIKRARLIDGGDPDAVTGQTVKSPDALIVVRFVFRAPDVERFQVKKKRQERILTGMAQRIPIFGRAIDNPRYEHRYRVRVNVSCTLDLIHVDSNETLHSYGRDLQEEHITNEGIWGFDARRLFELPTVETLISALIEEHVDNFLAKIVPIQRPITKQFKRVAPRLAAAVERLNAGILDGAIERAFSAWGRDKGSHEACFVLGLAWELKARRQEADWSLAERWYSRALEGESKDADYLAALDRAQSAAQDRPRVAGR